MFLLPRGGANPPPSYLYWGGLRHGALFARQQHLTDTQGLSLSSVITMKGAGELCQNKILPLFLYGIICVSARLYRHDFHYKGLGHVIYGDEGQTPVLFYNSVETSPKDRCRTLHIITCQTKPKPLDLC